MPMIGFHGIWGCKILIRLTDATRRFADNLNQMRDRHLQVFIAIELRTSDSRP